MFTIIFVLFLLATPALALAQAPASCEVQLEEARSINVQLRKAKAQADFTSASLEEALTGVNKQLEAEKAKHPAPKVEPKK